MWIPGTADNHSSLLSKLYQKKKTQSLRNDTGCLLMYMCMYTTLVHACVCIHTHCIADIFDDSADVFN